MRQLAVWIVAALLFALMPVFPADDGTLWKVSLAAMASANGADTVTSWRLRNRKDLRETGWLYGGKFGPQALGVKSGLVSGQTLAQWLIVRRHPRAAKWFAIFNFVQSVPGGVAAAHNARR